MKETFTHDDDIFKQRLEGYESQVPDDMFDRIMSQRDMLQPSDEIIKDKIQDYESPVSSSIFDRMMAEREPATPTVDDVFKSKLSDYESPIPADMFERVMGAREATSPTAIDTLLKGHLNNYESAVPSDMFERIMSERENRRPVAAWWQNRHSKWILMALLLLLVSVGGYILNKKTVENDENKGQNISFNSSNDKKATSEFHFRSDTLLITPEHNKPNEAPNEYLNTDLSTPKNNGTVIMGQKTETYQSIITKKAANRKSLAGKAASNTTIITSSTQQINNPITSASPVITPFNNIGYKTELNTTNKEDIRKDFSTEVNPLHIIADKNIALDAPSHETILKAIPCPQPDGCPTFGRKKGSSMLWYLDAYVAPEYASRKLAATSNEYNDYLTARDTIERTYYAYSAGVRATAMLPNGILLRGGMTYAQNNEKFQKDSFGIGNIRYVVDKNPNTGVLDTVEIIVTSGFYRKTRFNRYRSYDFTLQAGYEYPLSDNLTLGVNAGVNFNVSTAIKATVLAQGLQPLAVSPTNTIYKTKVGTSLVGSVAAYWRLSYNWQLMFEPQVRYYLNPITLNDYVLRQRYMNIGLNVGARYRF